MFINFVQAFFIAVYICLTLWLLKLDKNKYGISVKNQDGKILVDGSQGVQTVFGRGKHSDVLLNGQNMSRIQASVEFTGEGFCFHSWCKSDRRLGIEDGRINIIDEEYKVDRTERIINIPYTLIHLLMTVFILLLRSVSLKQSSGVSCIMPIGILIIYTLISYFISRVSNAISAIECSFAILLSFYINSMMFKTPDVKKTTIGVFVYTFTSIAARLFFTLVKSEKALFLLPENRFERFPEERIVTVWSMIRLLCSILIVALIGINMICAVNTNGTMIVAHIGGFSFQPSELIKFFMIVVLINPLGVRFTVFPERGKNYKDIQQWRGTVYYLIMPIAVFSYLLIIKDIGCLIEIAAIWVIAVCIQNVLLILPLAGIGLVATKIILKISATALSRYNAWHVEGSILKSVFNTQIKNDDLHYQQRNGLMSIVHGGMFGSKYYDVSIVKNIAASDSDMVITTIAERYGMVLTIMILMLFVTIAVAMLVNLGKQTKVSQTASVLSLSLIFIALFLNVLGSTAIVPFTGLVAPFLSSGISSAISFGSCIGLMSNQSINIHKIILTTPNVDEVNNISPVFKDKLLRRCAYVDRIIEKVSKSTVEAKEKIRRIRFSDIKDDRNKKVLKRIIAIVMSTVIVFFTFTAFGAGMKTVDEIERFEKKEHFVSSDKLIQDEYVKNILLLGVDARKGDQKEQTRSDAMMLISFNRKNNSINTISFLRDIYVYIPSLGKKQRLNAACSSGGYQGVSDAIEYNFNIPIEGYLTIDFNAFEDMIDALGGVEVNVTKKEAKEINSHPERYRKVKIKSGKNVLTGKQALAYSRIRKIDTDFIRTERQRTIISAILKKAKSASSVELVKMAKAVAPYLSSDLSNKELFSLACFALPCIRGEMHQEKVPFDHTWEYANKGGASVIAINTEKNRNYVKKYLYE